MWFGESPHFLQKIFVKPSLYKLTIVGEIFSGLVITFPAETAAPTDAKSVLAILVQNLQEQLALQQKEHRHGVWPTIFNPQH